MPATMSTEINAAVQLFHQDVDKCTKERMYATILKGMDWKRLRQELKECREKARLGQVALARLMHTNKSTINRIENLYGEPKHRPTLDKIDRWVTATGLTLSSFFARIEGLPESVGTGDDRGPHAQVTGADEALSPLTAEDRKLLRAYVEDRRLHQKAAELVGAFADRQAESERGSHRRHAPEADDPETSPRVRPRSPSQRHAKRRRLKSDRHKR